MKEYANNGIKENAMRAVVTVTGSDRRGIIAKVSGFLFERNVNIEDISQTILGDQFAMIMMVDTSESGEDFAALSSALEEMGKKIGMTVRLQPADIFDAMHNV